jgi:BMFP domain-containing protein YqiC
MKLVKLGILIVLVLVVVGGLIFGRDMFSYVHSGFRATQTAVKSNVPIEFELQRAQNLLEEIVPEMEKNIRMIAQEEVELAALKSDLASSEENFEMERQRIATLRNCLDIQKASYTFAGRDYSREELKQDLAWRFDRLKEAQIVLASKQEMLRTRENSLVAARDMLNRTRAQKQLLASKIEALEAKHRLQKASSIGTGIEIDDSKIAQTERLLSDIKKRLDVTDRMMAYESHFTQEIPVDGINEADLLNNIDSYLDGTPEPMIKDSIFDSGSVQNSDNASSAYALN